MALPSILEGCKIFPIVPGGKEPATANGWREASSDPVQIAAWQRINPDFNWAIATGLSGLFVIDVDPAGLDWWAKLLERDATIKAAVDRAFQVRTPRGGLHVYFKGEGPSTASRIAEGIDTRGGFERDGKIISGGYVLIPGSKTDKGGYTALPGGTLQSLPAEISGIVPARKKTDTFGLARNPDADQPRNVAWAKELIANYIRDGRVSKQGAGGNNLAFSVACSILDKAISPGMTFDLLWELWNPHCSPPWDDFELEGIVRNAAAYGEDTEGGVKGYQANTDAFASFAGQDFEPPAPKERDRLLWIHDFADSSRDPEWLIPNIIPAQGIGMIYGESGSFKSFLALDIALCLANGIPGQWGGPPVKHDVLFMAGEGPIATARKRWPAWLEWQGIGDRSAHRLILKDRVPFYSDTAAWQHVKEDLSLLGAKPSLIIIDTLTRLITGMDENSAKDASVITNFMEELSRYYECFVLAIHHTGKDQARGARGSSAFFANMDAVMSTKATKTGGTEFRVKKQKDADIADDMIFFKVKEMSQSIVLERSAAEQDNDTVHESGSRYAWASVEGVVATLTAMGGTAALGVLAQQIAGNHGIAKELVEKQLRKAENLKWLRSGTNWVLPNTDYDL